MKKFNFFLIVLITLCSGRIFPQYISPGLEGTHQNAFTKVSLAVTNHFVTADSTANKKI